MPQTNIQGHVFIVTYGRSGSTLLQSVLQSIDGYLIRGENNNALLSLFRSSKRIANAKIEHGYREIESFGPWYGIDQADDKTYACKLVAAFVDEVLRPTADTRVLGFKEIRFHEAQGAEFEGYLNFIAEHFPSTKFIFNHRNWQDVARSGWWKDCDPKMVEDLVTGADQQFEAYAAQYPERCFSTRYEQFQNNPGAFAPLFEFLGEPFDLEAVTAKSEKTLRH